TLAFGTGVVVNADGETNTAGTTSENVQPASDGTNSTTQQQSDNQGVNSSGVQTDNTTNSTANDQPAGDTGSASGQPVGTSRSADTGTQGDGSTNQPVAEPIMIIPSSASEPAPPGYVTVSFNGHDFTKGFTLGTQTGTSSVKVFVKNNVTWGELLNDPAWQWPTVKTDPGDTVVGWSFNKNYKPGVAFVFDTMKDQVVSNTSLYPNVVYEVEDVNGDGTKKGYLAQYGPDEQDKWIFITFDAGQGQLKRSKKSKMVAVSNNLKTIDFSNSLFTKKVESPTLQGHTFVRWQTQDGKVLPKSGTITTETTYEALYLAHPENQVAVFDSKKLTDSEKEQVKKNILDANPNLSTGVPQVIKAIDISATGEATVTFDDGAAVKVPSATLTNEDKDTARSNAKAEIEKVATEKSDDIKASNLTEEEKTARLTKVRDANDRANIAIDKAATTEDLTEAISDGTAAIKAVSTTNTIKTKAKQALEEAYNAKKDEIDNSSLTAEEKAEKQAELDKDKEEATKSIDTATTDDSVHKALTDGKSAITGIDTSTSTKKAQAKQALEEAYNAEKAEIENSALTAEEKSAATQAVNDKYTTAESNINNATTNDAVTQALNNGKTEIGNVSLTSQGKVAALAELQSAKEAKLQAIENSSLTDEEKSAKQAELDKAKADADKAIDAATDASGVDTALNKGKADIEAIETIISDKKLAARQQLEDAYSAKETEITNSNLTLEEKATKLKELDTAKEDAENAIDTATDNAGVDTALTNGQSAISGIDTSTSAKKEQAKQDLETAYNTEKAEIENSALTADEKVAKQAELTKAKENAIKAVDDATTDSAVEKALTNGKTAIESTYTAIIKIPSSTSETAPQGYVTVTFNKTPWDNGVTLGNQRGNSVRIFVKNTVTWGTLLNDSSWQWPTVITNAGDTVVGWAVNTSYGQAYSAENAFARDKYKDTVVTNTKLSPNVVYEVEDVNGDGTKKGYLAQYGPDEQDKWIFITFDAGQGQLKGSKTSKMVAVSNNLKSIDFSNSLFTGKVESPTLDGSTFVRWQTADGKVLPTSGTITSTEVYNALYLAHPTDKTTVFDANKLTETEKDSLKQAISNANPTSANLIQSITVSDTGEAKVTYNDGTVVTVPASHLINEDKEPARNLAKAEIDTASKEKVAEINASALTDEEKAAKLTEVQEAKDRANNAIDNATTTEDLTKALEDGKSEINAINTSTSATKAQAKQTLEDAYNAKKTEIENSALTAEEKVAKQEELDQAKSIADSAIDAATDNAGVAQALTDGKTAIAGIDTSTSAKKDQAKEELKAVADDAKKAIDANDNLTDAEKQAAKDAVDAEVAKAEKAIDAATKADEVDAATLAGEKAVAKEELKAAAEDAKNKIAKDVAAAKDAIDKNPNLSETEKQGFKDAVDTEAEKANQAIDAAKTPEAAQAAEEAGTAAIAEDVLDAAKLDAKNKIAKDLATVEAAIDANSNLSDGEKDAAKLAAQAKAAEAVANIEKATTPEAAQTLEDAAVKDLANIEIKAAYDDAVKAIEAADNLSTAAKTKALDDLKKARQAAEDAVKNATTADEVAKGALDGLKSIAKVEAKAAADDAKEAIAKNSNLTADEKKVYTDAIDAALKDTETKIDAATNADTVDAETVLAQKDIAKQEVAAATADAVKGIEANTNLTDAEKDEYKATVTKAAETAEKAITDATTAADIQSKTFDATQDVAKEEVKADAADAIAGIKANDNLSDTAKEEAIVAIEEARDTTLGNIENAKTAADVDTATLDAEKANAKAEIKAAADDAKKAIDENANLPESDKNALKLAIDAEVAATNLEIDNAKTAEEIDAATLAGEKAVAKEELKAAADDAKKAIDANTHLTDDQKQAAKDAVDAELAKAKEAVVAAKTADEVDAATLVGEKAVAKEEIKAAADDAKKAIDANDNLTDAEKAAAKDAVDAEVAKANDAIDAATKADEVDAATLAGEKAVAKEELKAAAEDAKKAIDANDNLTPEEKAAATKAVDAEVAKANDAIDAATKADEVDAATLAGEKAVAKEELKAAADDAKKAIDANDNLTPEEKAAATKAVDDEVAKAEKAIDVATKADEVDAATLVGEKAVAKEEVKAAAEDAKAAIDANDNLTDAEKQAAKDAVDAEVAKANDAIDAATKADEVDAATLAGEKAVAKEELKVAAEDAKKAIEANDNLTDAEKQAAKDAVDAEVAKANDAIDAATKADEVDAATLVGEKALAKEELKAAAEDAKKAIDANDNLTDAEKVAAKDAVDAEVAKANDAIDAATKADEVDTATLAGEKAVAKEEVKAAAEDAKKAIDANDNLTDAEKQAAKDAVDAEVAKANEAIDAATKADEVDTATLAGEKAVAKEEVKAAAEDAKKAIDANDNLTDAEKVAAKDAVDAEVAKANEAIDAATKADEVDAATLAGEKAVAKEELKAAVEDAKKAIDANPNLSDAEKQAAKDAVDASAAAANKAIDGSTSSVEVQAAKDKGN
ncbi:DUF1542 domain-containing protein, partial [Streptococcus suis]|uniref:DUF1542 domain-containing protein n=1 Tax=Streptococcus suis TaxID=1307 RepID=UPI00147947A5